VLVLTSYSKGLFWHFGGACFLHLQGLGGAEVDGRNECILFIWCIPSCLNQIHSCQTWRQDIPLRHHNRL